MRSLAVLGELELPGRLRRRPQRAAARRPGRRVGRTAAVHPAVGTRRGGGRRRRRVPRDPRGSRSRPRATAPTRIRSPSCRRCSPSWCASMPLSRKASSARRAPRRPADSESAEARPPRARHRNRRLQAVRERLDARFDRAVELLAACRGKVVVTGIGKSGLICRKIAATLASTGTAGHLPARRRGRARRLRHRRQGRRGAGPLAQRRGRRGACACCRCSSATTCR